MVRVYDFTFGFCIPNSTNTWEAIYDVPQYTQRQIADYVSYAVGGRRFVLPSPELRHAFAVMAQLDDCCLRASPVQVASPFEHKSDSYYFVDGKLIMHNKVGLSPCHAVHDRCALTIALKGPRTGCCG